VALELGSGGAGRLEVAGRDGDLDLGGQTSKPPQRLLGLRERTGDPRSGGADLPLGKRSSASPGCGSRPSSFALP